MILDIHKLTNSMATYMSSGPHGFSPILPLGFPRVSELGSELSNLRAGRGEVLLKG